MTLRRRNGKFLVFRRSTFAYYTWCCARVERGALNIFFTNDDWNVVMKAAGMFSQGKVTEFGIWLDGYNTLTRERKSTNTVNQANQ